MSIEFCNTKLSRHISRENPRQLVRWFSPRKMVAFTFALAVGLSLALATPVFATNWYVRPSSQGSNNGTDWNNAWSLNGISWSSVKAGDTVWLAGGTYSTTFTLGTKGAAGNPIYVKRVLATDAVPSAAAGWSASFDAQVLVAPSSASVLSFVSTAENGSYFYVDGRKDSGIKLLASNGSGAYNAPLYIGYLSDIHDTTFVNVDCAGPDDGTNPNFAHLGNNAALTIRAVNNASSIFNTISNLTFVSCRFHGAANLVTAVYAVGITWEKCKFYDNVAIGTPGSIAHQNMFELVGCGNLVYANCEMWNWAVEGLMPYGSSKGEILMYGCLWRDCYLYPGGATVARVLEVFTNYKIRFYNNTFVNLPFAVYSSSGGGSYASGSECRNNIYWNCSVGSFSPTMDYEFSSGSISGANSISSGSNPFVNYAGKDFRLAATTGTKYPKDRGTSLSSLGLSKLSSDMNGVNRGADGAWDMGAFEQGAGVASTNPVIAVSTSSVQFGSLIVGATTNLTLTVQNVGAGTLSGSVSASLPFSIVSGGNYSLGSNQSQVVTFRYAPTAAGSHSQSVSFTGGGGASVTLLGSAWAPLTGSTFSATNGTITSPMTASGGSISQSSETTLAASGKAVYGFMITNAGNYQIAAVVNAPSSSANSLFVNIDAEPTDPTSIWDVPVTAGFESRTLAWRGTGTDTTSQFSPKTFTLGVGTHQLIVRGREAGVQISQFAIVKIPEAPFNLVALPAQ